MTDRFARLQGRDLTGRTRWLPDAFGEGLNLVFVAFRRDQQTVIDSWATWLRGPEVANCLAFWEADPGAALGADTPGHRRRHGRSGS